MGSYFHPPTNDLHNYYHAYVSHLYIRVCTLAISEVLIGFMMKYHGYTYEKAKENRDNCCIVPWLRVQVGTGAARQVNKPCVLRR